MRKQGGFTLLEILVAMLVGVAAITVAVAFLYSQQRVNITQQAVVEMQQELRAAMALMTREIRMAGYDPTGRADAGFVRDSTGRNSVGITMDLKGDSDASPPDGVTDDENENVLYSLSRGKIGRATGGGNPQPLARNIEALDFVYLDEDGGVVNDVATDADRIRAVEITMVGRCGEALPGLFVGYTDTTDYRNGQGEVLTLTDPDGTPLANPPLDKFRRIALTATVTCRNIGLPSP